VKILVVIGVGEGWYIGQLYHPQPKRQLDTSGYGFGEPIGIGRVRAVIDDHGGKYALMLSVSGLKSQREWGVYLGAPHFQSHLTEREIWLIPESIISQMPEFKYGRGFWDDATGIHLD